MRPRTMAHLLVASAACAGCAGLIGDGGDSEGPGTDSQALCSEAAPDAGATPLRRLTRDEYDNTVRDLMGIDASFATSFVPDEIVAGFAANSVTSPSKLQLEDYLYTSETIVEQALAAHQSEWLSCDIAQTSCVQPFLAELGKRAFRRPLTAELEQSLVSLYEQGRANWGAQKGLELALVAILNSPHFLYHVELTLPAAGEAVAALDGYEMAARLSYFLWHTMPDSELLAAAESGALGTPEGIAEQARRMLAGEHAAEALDVFHAQWLELDVLDELVKDPDLFPEYSEQLAHSMREETLAFTRDIVQSGGSAEMLLTATHSFVDSSLADLYGIDAPPTEFGRVELDSATRAGLLTQAAFLATRSHAAETSWVLRGKFVREKLLCETLPPPPPNVDQKQANDPNRLEDPQCGSCHQMMDPIGYGFDRYDAIGRYNEKDADGNPIAHSGEVVGNATIGTFEGAVELAKELATVDQVKECLVTQWFRFATRRAEATEDSCSIADAYGDFAASGFDFRELLVAIATSDAFRYRRVALTEGN
ncbi:MAG TPA: DUF1592 domain-containing protein [Polyangiaceae bacterium]|nr:DUF1592 domain-containing protein [Polyangiaceae bacterium]